MKKNTMVKTLLAAALVLSTTTAFAGDVQYERQGRFLKRVASVEKQAPAAQSTVVAADQKAEGQYYREGRFVKRNGLGGQRGIVKTEVASANIQHDHGINGKGHQNLSN